MFKECVVTRVWKYFFSLKTANGHLGFLRKANLPTLKSQSSKENVTFAQCNEATNTLTHDVQIRSDVINHLLDVVEA